MQRGETSAGAVGEETEPSALRLLRLMAKKGASALPDAAGATFRIEQGSDAPRLLETVPATAMEPLACNGWIAQSADGSWRLTRKGGVALRRALSRSHDPAATHNPRPAPPPEMREAEPRRARPARPSAGPCESPLDWLRRHRDRSGAPLITDEQFAAGERLRADHHFAGLDPRVTASWSVVAPCTRGCGGAAGEIADNVLAARERVNRALMAVGPELAGVLVDVCCNLRGLEQVEQRNGWALRSAKVVLQLALSALARHYGMIPPTACSRPRSRHWGAPDYRPAISEPTPGDPDPSRQVGY